MVWLPTMSGRSSTDATAIFGLADTVDYPACTTGKYGPGRKEQALSAIQFAPCTRMPMASFGSEHTMRVSAVLKTKDSLSIPFGKDSSIAECFKYSRIPELISG